MTRVELIRLIGDVLRQLDNLKTTRPADLNGAALIDRLKSFAKAVDGLVESRH